MPTKQEILKNQEKFNLKASPEFRKKFRNMGFFHQFVIGSEFGIENKMEEILKSHYLISLKSQGLNAEGSLAGTLDIDKEMNRDEYVYFRLGAIVNCNCSRSIIFEIPPKYIQPIEYRDGFFCNDIIQYYKNGDFMDLDYQSHKDTILSIQQGINILADYVASEFNTEPTQYLTSRTYGELHDGAEFSPEFAIKDRVSIHENDVKIHIVGLSNDLTEKITETMKLYDYQSPIIHKTREDFLQYLFSSSSL